MPHYSHSPSVIPTNPNNKTSSQINNPNPDARALTRALEGLYWSQRRNQLVEKNLND